MAVYHPRSNRQKENFMDTLKRALRKNQGVDMNEKSIQNFLAVYGITPNTSTGLYPAELMPERKIRSVYDRLLRNPAKKTAKKENYMTKAGYSFFKKFRVGKMKRE